jgi:hypothetical protein
MPVLQRITIHITWDWEEDMEFFFQQACTEVPESSNLWFDFFKVMPSFNGYCRLIYWGVLEDPVVTFNADKARESGVIGIQWEEDCTFPLPMLEALAYRHPNLTITATGSETNATFYHRGNRRKNSDVQEA